MTNRSTLGRVAKSNKSENKKDAVIAKISHHTGMMYEETFRLLEIPSVKALVSKELLNNFTLSSLFTDKKENRNILLDY